MSVIQPQILYTGQNAARPDFKGMTKDIQNRMAQVDRERQQQKQFDMQRQDQMNRDFLKTVDVDKLNFVDASLQQKSLDAYKQFDESVSKMVQDKKGNLTTQDIMNGKAMASTMEQQMGVWKNWDNNRKQDIVAFHKDPGKYDQEHFKENTLYWDTDTPYNESRLKIAAWDLGKTQQVLRNTFDDEQETQSRIFNKDKVQVKASFDSQYWETEKLPNGMTVPKLDDEGRGIPNYKTQGNRVKQELGIYDNVQGREGLVKGYSKLSASDQKMWDDIAMNNGLTTKNQGDVQGDGEIMWMLSPDGANKNPFKLDVAMSEKKKPSETKIIRNLSGKQVPYLTTSRTLDIAGDEYNAYSIPQAVNIPSFTMKNATVIVDGKKSEVKDITSKGKLTDVIIEDGKISMYKIEKPSERYKKNELGETVYKIDNIGEGTYEELLQDAKVMYGDKVDMNWIKRKAKASKDEGRTETVLLPAEDNQSLTELFRIEGVSNIYKAKKDSTSIASLYLDKKASAFSIGIS